MQLLEGVGLSQLCDYSFGDQSGSARNCGGTKVYTQFMKDANISNKEFLDKVSEIKKERDYMTLFIDNVRLYNRKIKQCRPGDVAWVNSLMEKSDLLKLCKQIPDMNFIIFTNLEAAPIDEYIHGRIPKNVLGVFAANAIPYENEEKLIPSPLGVQRRLHPNDNRMENIISLMDNKILPTKLLYICHSDSTHQDRIGIKNLFSNKSWATVNTTKIDHLSFMKNICDHKFMICPRGLGMETHRNYEILYLRRVPVMKRYGYLEEVNKNYPVLFVDNYSDVTEELLINNEHLYEQAQTMDLSMLTLPSYYENTLKNILSSKK